MNDPTEVPLGAKLTANLSAAAPRIIERFEAALAQQGNTLLRTETSRREILSHARQLLQDLTDEFAGHHVATTRRSMASDIGQSRAAQGFHPGESLRAAGILFNVVLTMVSETDGPDRPSVAEVLAVAVVMNDVLVRAISLAADSYAAFQLDRIHSAHVVERRRISRELHDRIGHGVNLAFRNLELYETSRDQEQQRPQVRIGLAAETLRELLDVVPQIISDLRAAEPVDSLEKALRYFIESADQPTVTVHLQVTGDEHWASPDIRDEAFLILREAMRNTFAHARAQAVLVRVQISPDDLRATVRDDGIGFEMASVKSGRAGMVSMRERAALLGGTVVVTSAPGRGTTVELVMPVRKDDDHG